MIRWGLPLRIDAALTDGGVITAVRDGRRTCTSIMRVLRDGIVRVAWLEKTGFVAVRILDDAMLGSLRMQASS